MQASKVTLSRETRAEIASNPLLHSRKAKSRFRAQKIIDYINSKPSGHKFGTVELISVAGYTDDQYASGYAFVKRLQKDGILWIEKNNKFKKGFVVCKNADGSKLNTVKVSEPKKHEIPEETVEKVSDEDKIVEEKAKQAEMCMISERNESFRNEVKSLAKDFAWDHNSDSLREFINKL